MTANINDVSQCVAEWMGSTGFTDGYIFGSLVHKNGAQFDAQYSDVDIICRIVEDDTYLKRCQALQNANASVRDLNLALLKLFNRNDASKPIASVVPATSFELEFGLHKDKASQFFSHNEFHCVRSGSTTPIGKEHKQQSARNEGALDSIREAQRNRNKALSVAPNGSVVLDAYDGPDVLPKTFARCAAQVRWACEDNPRSEQRFDVNEGLVYTLQLLTARRKEAPQVDDLFHRTVVRMGGRGQPSALSVDDQILLWEILVDDVTGLILSGLDDEGDKPKLRLALQRERKNRALAHAGFKCSFPGCGVPLGEDGIGEIAHIVSPFGGGPRHDPSMKPEEAVDLDNLVVLCPTHHRMIDASPDEFSAETIKGWNKEVQDETRHPVFNSENLFTIVRIIMNLL